MLFSSKTILAFCLRGVVREAVLAFSIICEDSFASGLCYHKMLASSIFFNLCPVGACPRRKYSVSGNSELRPMAESSSLSSIVLQACSDCSEEPLIFPCIPSCNQHMGLFVKPTFFTSAKPSPKV